MTKKTNGEGSITTTTRNEKTYYIGKVTVGFDSSGKQLRKTFGSFKKTIVIEKMNKAKMEYKENTSYSDYTLEKLFLYWLENYKKVEVTNKTFHKYLTAFKLRIEPYSISKRKARLITLSDLQDYFNELSSSWSISSIKEVYTYINACMEFALIQDIINKNYCKGVILQKQIIEKKIKAFSLEEESAIIKLLDLSDIVDSVIYFTFYTGLRLGEVLGLKWKDISNNMMHITRQLGRVKYDVGVGQELKRLKTNGSERDIPLPNKALNLLENLPHSFELIFTDSEKGMDHKRPQRRVRNICKRLNIKDMSFHSIRHTYATRLFELGVDVKTVQALLGHSDITTTMNIYTHVMQEKKLEVLDKLNMR